MIKFNSNNIFVGQIKELLSSTNLPLYKILVDGEKVYIFKGISYIYNNSILIAKNTKSFDNGFVYDFKDFEFKDSYYYGQNILNITHNLVVNTNTYDYKTHNKLGNYLRFMRDYNKLDLMSMYNCFNGQVANNIDIDFKLNNSDDRKIFNTTDNSYKILTIPVKYYKKYSIYLDCSTTVEMVVAFYDNNNQLNDLVVNTTGKVLEDFLYPNTYVKTSGLRFNEPFIYDKLENLLFNLKKIDKEYLSKIFSLKELELTLLLKIPASNTSSLVVLEGEYESDELNKVFTNNLFSNYPKNIVNYANLQLNDFKSTKQLVYLNDENNYAFADRLKEYLVDNVITPLDDIQLNTKRVETNLINKGVLKNYTKHYEWTNDLRTRIYLNAQDNGLLNNKFDILGYVDKDVESNVVGFEDNSTEWEG